MSRKVTALATSTTLAVGLGIGLGACGSSGSSASQPAPHAQATHTAPAVNYKSQYLTDVAAANADAAKITSSDTITSPAVIAYGTAAGNTARVLLQQEWPANAQADVHTVATAAELVSADIQAGNLSKLMSDGTVLKADTQVVRADLGLPAK